MPPPGSVAERVRLNATFSLVANVVVVSTGLLDPPPPPPPHAATQASTGATRTPSRIRRNCVVSTISLPDESACDTATFATESKHALCFFFFYCHELGLDRIVGVFFLFVFF